MKKITALFICFTLAVVFCFAQVEPVTGFWLSVDDNTNKVTAGWQIYIENGVLYGKILSLADEPRGTIATECRESYRNFPIPGRVNTMPVAGTPWIYGLTKQRNGEWSGGRIINPEDGRDYNCKIIFHPAGSRINRTTTFNVDILEMRGEIGFGIGRSQFWRRTDEATASNLWPN
jgi:uncharacterized protein (DUF2147 family)